MNKLFHFKDKVLTVLFAKFLTRQLRQAVLPNKAVTFLDAFVSKYGPLLKFVLSVNKFDGTPLFD